MIDARLVTIEFFDFVLFKGQLDIEDQTHGYDSKITDFNDAGYYSEEYDFQYD